MSRFSIVGSGSLMPESFYLQKVEQSCVYEPEDQTEMYFRDVLRDTRPDKPFFESDQPRRDNHSGEKLALRHGGRRVNTDPYLPEGSFIDYPFLDKDPRGIVVQPDMMQYRGQSEARGKFIKQGNDEDNSIPSSGWHPTHLVRDMRSQFYNQKARMKIFSESTDGRQNGGVGKSNLTTSNLCLLKTDDRKPLMRDEICYTRSNYLNEISNEMRMGWHGTTDHIFQIAKYGQSRPNAPLSEQDWAKNRANSRVEHDVMISWKDQIVPRSLSIKMIDMVRKKANDIEAGRTIMFSEGKTARPRTKKLSVDDLSGVRPDVESRAVAANAELRAERAPYQIAQPELDSRRFEKSVVDPFIRNVMCSVNRKLGPLEIKDLREQVQQSGAQYGVMVEGTNIERAKPQIMSEILRKTSADHFRGQSIHITNYSAVVPCYDIAKYNTEAGGFEESRARAQRRGALTNSMYNMESMDFDTSYGNEVTTAKQIGHIGSKYVRELVDHSSQKSAPMGDIEAKNYSVY